MQVYQSSPDFLEPVLGCRHAHSVRQSNDRVMETQMTPDAIEGLRDRASAAGDLPVVLTSAELNALLDLATGATTPAQVMIDQATARDCLEFIGPASFGLRKRLAEKLQAGIKQSEELQPGYVLIAAPIPAELHPQTRELIPRFMAALAEKLFLNETKHGVQAEWAEPDWIPLCRSELVRHVMKGDVRDVAAYCAFLWHHGQPAALTEAEFCWKQPLGFTTVRDGQVSPISNDPQSSIEQMVDGASTNALHQVFIFPLADQCTAS